MAASEAGAAPTIDPGTAARIGPVNPIYDNRSTKPTCCIAHKATYLTAIERGRTSSSEVTSIVWISAGSSPCGGGCVVDAGFPVAVLVVDAVPVGACRDSNCATMCSASMAAAFGSEGWSTGLSSQQLFDAVTQCRPELGGDRKIATQVKQRDLFHLATDTFVAHQAIGVMVFAGGIAADFSTSNKQTMKLSQAQVPRKRPRPQYGTTFADIVLP